MSRRVGHRHLNGALSYAQILKAQSWLVEQKYRTGLKTDVLLTVEHQHPVFTAGRRLRNQTEEKKRIEQHHAQYYEVQRGGQVTFHGPGQLVGYPILDLRHFDLTARCYVHTLEKLLIRLCQQYGIEAATSDNVGVWVENERKIAAIGVHIAHHMTCHGFALNCTTDLAWYDLIVPCGITDKGVTSVAEELRRRALVGKTADPQAGAEAATPPSLAEPHQADVDAVLPTAVHAFAAEFDCEVAPLQAVDPQLDDRLSIFLDNA
ncbi:hypothetical protein CXG81DRAFT_8829 [Caulochytrium protostelioides]|uniref:lipoyl(octanoyl) transferase n=1 Tax=Caulochytrium protostelioides TaxID=1555241 RepID=A0A4P9XEL2_9FUNG|nr:hypothetical protein CXG81DRAFT_8829 [Caulochytrium protostelioides]|eukprot:RKP03958.1 hypothetical protein CXG81DRAFT_8829 [Caulochytrium protostelioides]